MNAQFWRFYYGNRDNIQERRSERVYLSITDGEVVIGETAEIEDDVVLFPRVSLLGGLERNGKRHPTIKRRNVVSQCPNLRSDHHRKDAKMVGAVVLKDIPDGANEQ